MAEETFEQKNTKHHKTQLNNDKDNFGMSARHDSKKTQLMYPLDLGDGAFYQEAIRFEIIQRNGVSLKEVGTSITKASKHQTYNNGEMKGGLTDNLISNDQARTENKNIEDHNRKVKAAGGTELKTLIGTNTAEKIMYGASEVMGNVQTQLDKTIRLKASKQSEKLIGSIMINMPASVQFNEQVDWQSQDLGLVGGMMKGSAGGLKGAAQAGAVGAVGQMVGGAAGAILSKFMGTGGLGGGLIGAALGSNSALQSAVEVAGGVKSNPFKEQTFQGIGFRPFEFSFTFRARSDTEMEEIARIIMAFRGFSKPSFRMGEMGSGLFDYPEEFKISFLTLDNYNDYGINKYLPEIKYCVCKAVNTNFTGSGWKAFKDGAPVDITLQLTFEETELITQEDVFGKTKIGRFSDSGGHF